MKHIVLTLLVGLFSIPTVRADDWPQWRGPNRDGISKEKGLLKEWPKDGPPLAWKATGVGAGYSSVSVAKGRIFTMGNIGSDEHVIALSEKDGNKLWSTPIGAVRANGGGYPGPRCTPTVDGDVLYALGINGDLVCLEVATGKERWKKDLAKEFHGQAGGWGYAESPLVDGDRVVATPGGKEATLVALNKKTGDVIWKSSVGDSAGYSSIVIGTVGGVKQYIQFTHSGVIGVAAKDGALLWRYNKPANGTANITTPIFSGDEVFAASAYGTGGGAVKLVANASGVKADELYFTKHMQNHHGGVILLGEQVYGFDEGTLRCLNFKSGAEVWDNRSVGKGSITFADGHFYARSEGGPLALIEASPTSYIEHGRFNQPDRSGQNAWPHPAIANGKLYIRDQDVLLCFDVKDKSGRVR